MNKLEGMYSVIEANLDKLRLPGVIAVHPGYKSEPDGRLTTQMAVVAVVDPKQPRPELPKSLAGFPVDVRAADAVELLAVTEPALSAKVAATREEFAAAFPEAPSLVEQPAAVAEALSLLAAKQQLPYTAPKGTTLKKVSGKIPIVCHASPDAGWPTLKEFLSKTNERLTVGMYDFTSEHILESLEGDLPAPKALTITLDNPARNPTADQSDTETLKDLRHEIGKSLSAAWALNRANRQVKSWIYPSAYHIKVAVRDGSAVWLSSGNWNNSNQPDFQPSDSPTDQDQQTARTHDRDWHVIIKSTDLAETLEAYLRHDYDVAHEQAEKGEAPVALAATTAELVPFAFAPAAVGNFTFRRPLVIDNEDLEIIPLLTPDPGVYLGAMLELVQSTNESLYIQLQYIHPSDAAQDAKFAKLVDAVMQKSSDGKDVRVIVSQWQATKGWLDRLQASGFDLGIVKMQNGVHNKGFVVDHEFVAIGSQNWSGDGVLRNRDASVIIRSKTAARYFEAILLDDWTNIAMPPRVHILGREPLLEATSEAAALGQDPMLASGASPDDQDKGIL